MGGGRSRRMLGEVHGSSDTHSAIEALVIAGYRRMSGAEAAQQILEPKL